MRCSGAAFLICGPKAAAADLRAPLRARSASSPSWPSSVAVSLWTPLAVPRIAERWFSMPNILYLWPVPLLTAFLAWRSGARSDGRPRAALLCGVGVFVLCYLGLAVSNFPYLVPPSLTVWDTAAAPASQIFTLIGVVFLLPLILAYTAFVYWTFRGKLEEGEGYH